jgi:putative hydrolase of the HAD superfamily
MFDQPLTIPKAILLDMDDTILDSRRSSRECWTNLCDRHAPRINGITPAKLLSAIYDSIQWYWEDPERNTWGRIHPVEANREVVSRAFHHMGIDADGIADEIADGFHIERIQTIRPFPGAIDCLRHFRDMGIRLALITNGNGKMQRLKIDRNKLDRFFDYILIEDEFGVGKPNQQVYLHTLDQLGTAPHDAWMIGDNLECDVAGPQRLGIYSVWNDFQHAGLPDNAIASPDKIIHSLSELVPIRGQVCS